MRVTPIADPRPEAMADVPGVCDLPLTRAVVLYRDVHEIERPVGRVQDIGMAVVVEGRFAASARVIDLGSAQAKYLDLSTELVVLDWVYDPTLSHIRFLADGVEATPDDDNRELAKYCFDVAVRILNRTGFNSLTRSTVLRIGYRDICRDLDFHEGTAVRVAVGGANLVRVHLDYDDCTLVFRSPSGGSNSALEEALVEVFRGGNIHRVVQSGRSGSASYQVRFGVPVNFAEAQANLGRVRRGLNHLVARFEPDRFEALHDLVDTFGERGTLDRLAFREPRVESESVHQGRRMASTAIH